MEAFQVPYDGPHGATVDSDDPKLDAYKAAAWVIFSLGCTYTMTFHADGDITVAPDADVVPTTYHKVETAKPARPKQNTKEVA